MNNITRLKWGPKKAAAHYKVYSGVIYNINKYYSYLSIRRDL